MKLDLWPKLEPGFDKAFGRKPGSGSLTLGAIVDMERAGAGLEYQHRFTRNVAAYAQGSIHRTWAGKTGAEAFGGVRIQWP